VSRSIEHRSLMVIVRKAVLRVLARAAGVRNGHGNVDCRSAFCVVIDGRTWIHIRGKKSDVQSVQGRLKKKCVCPVENYMRET
jgi:hypothetical protein